MATNLYWREIPKEESPKSLGRPLKYLLAKKLWNSDGGLPEKAIIVSHELIPYLEGVCDAGGMNYEEAKILIQIIQKYEKVEIYIE